MKKFLVILAIAFIFVLIPSSSKACYCDGNITLGTTRTNLTSCDVGYSGSYVDTCTRIGTSDKAEWVTSNSCKINSYSLTISKEGTGFGSVTGSGNYNYGTSVLATATPNTDSTFDGWTGDCASDGSVTVNSQKTCTATFTLIPTPTTATISATKIVCDKEEYLPNWGAGGSKIISTTASDFLSSNSDHCKSVDWNFEWADSSASNPGDLLTEGGTKWSVFSNSSALTIPAGQQIRIREQMNDSYIPFTGTNTDKPVSAEFYCSTDVYMYDNFNVISTPIAGTTYYCVGFNVLKTPSVTSYTVTATGTGSGTITPATQSVNSGSTTTFTVTPEAGYQATIGGTCPAGTLTGTTYTTAAITSDCTVTASFTLISNPTTLALNTDTATSITKTSAILNGSVITVGSTNPTIEGFEYGLTNTYGSTINTTGSFSVGAYTGNISSLQCNTTYYYRAYATDSSGNQYGEGKTFNTSSCGGGSSGGSIPQILTGRILGESTACGIYVDKFVKIGLKGNDKETVKKIQIFLNDYMGSGLKIDGIVGIKTDAAIKAFQVKRFEKVLAPWGLSAPTGIFYLTTQTEVNNIMCPPLNLPIPTLTPTAQNDSFPKY